MTKHQKTALLRICLAAALLIALHFVPVDGWLRFALYLIPDLTVGAGVLQRAVQGIANRQPFDENLLMAVATVGAMVLGEYPEGVAVMLFYQIGELFEDYAVGKSRRNISDLMDICPEYANIEEGGELKQVDPDEVSVGAIPAARPGADDLAKK